MEEDLAYLRTLSVLYVEDVPVVRERTALALKSLVGTLTLANDGHSGLEAFRSQRPQVVITDIVMPEGNGLALAGAIRELDPGVPIIVTTAYDNTEYLVAAIELGVTRYVFKPVDEKMLTKVLLTCARHLNAEEQLLRKRHLEEEAVRLQHLDTLSELARGMGHDFNNLLQGVLGALSVARMSTPSSNPLHGILELAERSANQARELGLRLILLAKGCRNLNQTAAIGPLLRATVEQVLKGSPVTCEYDLPEPMAKIAYSEQHLQSLIAMVATNAKEAMADGGTLTVRARPLRVGSKDTLSLSPGEYQCYTFQDSGAGIAEADLPRVFDPYFSTKPVKNQKGIGLSLAIARAIAMSHGGQLTAKSSPGRGAAFELVLPVAAE